MYSCYFTAILPKDKTWLVAGILRNETHTVLDRCLNKVNGEFEFFVPPDCVHHFLRVMDHLGRQNLVFNLQQKPNRLSSEQG